MELTEFFDELKNEIELGKNIYNDTGLAQFVRIYTEKLQESGEINGFEECFYQDQSRGIRVDGYWEDNEEGIISLFVSDYDDSIYSPELLSKNDMEKAFNRVKKFINLNIDHNLVQEFDITSPEYLLSNLIKQKMSSFFKINIYILSERRLSSRIKFLDIEEIYGKPVYKHVWDLTRIYQLEMSKSHKEAVEIDCLDMFNHGIPCLHVDSKAEEYDSYLAVICGKDLADLYALYDSRLLEKNVRTFLQARGKVNKGISDTIRNNPSMFFAYNNGITATAQNVQVKDGVIVHLTDLQIVNGGQTTASLFHTRRKDKVSLEKIFVQMKLSVIDPDRSEEIVPKISEYANTQNKVNAADFFSNAPFHLRMQEISRRVIAPARPGAISGTQWFYERVRGQYVEAQSKLTPAQMREFQAKFPKQQIFSKEDLAKYENVWDELPKIVSQGRQKNFAAYAERIGKEWEKDENGFNDEYYKQAVARAIIFRETEKIVSTRPWYRPGGSVRSYIVYYSLACLGELAKRHGSVIPFMIVWEKQDIPDFLFDAIETSADYINEHIEKPTDTLLPRDSEWFKKDVCWNTIQNYISRLEEKLTDKFWKGLISQIDENIRIKDGKAGKVIKDELELQKTVISIQNQTWKEIGKNYTKLRLSPQDMKELTRIIQFPGRPPAPWRCRILLKIFNRAIEESIVSNI